jgi:acetate kinase
VSTPARVLVLNAGSATLKAAVLDLPDTTARSEHTMDWAVGGMDDDRHATLERVVAAIEADGVPIDSIAAVGHRGVHGGERFTSPVVLDDPTIDAIEALADLAPLHNPAAVATIRAARRRIPAVPHVAAFDTAFHATLPLEARRYPVPDDWVATYGIRRYGFHGLSVEWSVRRAADRLARPSVDLGLIVAHLGGGCSVTAVEGGRSVHTSMGLSPLEGLMMATRAGSIDPSIVFRLARGGVGLDEIERGLDRDSGLLGVGGSADMRVLQVSAAAGDQRAGLAIDLFVRSAAAGIAAAATSLASLDGLVFTGGIGEGAHDVRARICDRLRLLQVPAVLRVHAREDVVIAQGAVAVLEAPPES